MGFPSILVQIVGADTKQPGQLPDFGQIQVNHISVNRHFTDKGRSICDTGLRHALPDFIHFLL